jgi:hypothetical protein
MQPERGFVSKNLTRLFLSFLPGNVGATSEIVLFFRPIDTAEVEPNPKDVSSTTVCISGPVFEHNAASMLIDCTYIQIGDSISALGHH